MLSMLSTWPLVCTCRSVPLGRVRFSLTTVVNNVPAYSPEIHAEYSLSILRVSSTVSSHNLSSHSFKLRVSNPRTIAYVDFNMPFESSNIQGLGSFFRLSF